MSVLDLHNYCLAAADCLRLSLPTCVQIASSRSSFVSSTSFGLYHSRKQFQRRVVQAMTAPRQLRHLLLLHRAMMAAVQPALGPWTLLTTTSRAQKPKPTVSNSCSNITSNRQALIRGSWSPRTRALTDNMRLTTPSIFDCPQSFYWLTTARASRANILSGRNPKRATLSSSASSTRASRPIIPSNARAMAQK